MSVKRIFQTIALFVIFSWALWNVTHTQTQEQAQAQYLRSLDSMGIKESDLNGIIWE
jgi:hypothetical protein